MLEKLNTPLSNYSRIAFSIIFSILAIVSFSKESEGILTERIESKILILINQYRESIGLSSLTISDEISLQARNHSMNMASKKVGFGSDGFPNRIEEIRREMGGDSFSENVASGSKTAEEAVTRWIRSAVHKKNIEDDFTHFGVGVAQSRTGTLYFTQIFVKIDPDSIFLLNEDEDLDVEIQIIELVNNHRASLGLKPLKISKAITGPSQVHSQNMASGKVGFSHEGFYERTEEIKRSIGGNSFAENLAYGQSTAESVVNSWLDSPDHRLNIEGDFTHVGVGIAKSERGVIFFTQIFARIN